MATYYVDAQNGSNGNAGTAAAPWLTLTYAVANSTNGDILKVRGTFREADVIISGSSDRVITNWGSGPWYMRNTRLVTGWSAGAGLYTKNIGAGLNVKCLIVDWNTSINANGQHYGHVQALSAVTNVGTTDNSWFYNSGTGLLSVRIGANLDPAGFTVEYGLGGSSALIQMEGCTNCTVNGFDMGPNPDGAAGKGYSILWSGTGNQISGTDTDCGYHGPGLVANGVYALSGNTCGPYVSSGSWGDSAGTGQLSRFVTYIQAGAAAGANNYYTRCTAYKTLPLLRDGVTYMTAPVSGGTAFVSSGGFYWHGGSGTHASLTHYRCRVVGISGGTVSGSIDFCGADSVQPTDGTNWNTYSVKNIECEVIGGDSNLSPGAGLNTSQAFVRCRLDYSLAGTIGSSQVRCGYTGATASGSTWGHFNCQIMCDLNNASGRTLYGVTSANRLVFVQCSFLEYGSNSNNNFRNFFNWASTPTVGIYARNCVFAFRNTNVTKSLQTNDSTIAAGLHNFLGCCYRNISANFFSANTAFDSQAEWTSTVDTQATIASVDPYTVMTGLADLQLVASIAAVVRPWQPNATIGVNNVPMAKQFGSWGTVYGAGESRSSGGRTLRVSRVARV